MFNLFKSIMHLLRQDGVVGVFAKAFRIFRRNGAAGLCKALRFAATPAFLINEYADWIRLYDTLSDEDRADMATKANSFKHRPLITVLMPVYKSTPRWLIEAIESVKRQTYPNWELCIVDDASEDGEMQAIFERFSREDSRIKVKCRETNGHISAASNDGLMMASGEWVALLDHDDLMSESALFWLVDAINANPDVRLIYSDEDKIDEISKRHSPYFKCDWNVDLFYSHNLITHLGAYKLDLIQEVGGFRIGFEGAQDYDLALRCIEKIRPDQIHHIPRVLYHWRVHSGSTAQSAEAKPYAMIAGEKALNDHFQRMGVRATSELRGHGYRTHYLLPEQEPMVSIIIPTRNGLSLTRQCVESIQSKTTYSNYQIVIVDNGSDDPSMLQYFEYLKNSREVRILRDERPFNYSSLNNAAVRSVQGEFVALLNNDVEVISPEWLSEMVAIAMQPGVGAVGARLWYPSLTLQHAGIILLGDLVAGHAHKGLSKHSPGYAGRASHIQSFSAVTGACMVVRKSVYEEVGGLNEVDLKVAFNDVDFCLRLKEAGYRNVWTPYAELFHHESATRGYEDTPEKKERFASESNFMKNRWGNILWHDPAYSPNLTLDNEGFGYAWPPRN